MKKHIVALFAQSPIHVGAGNSVGAVDLPVVRERHTRIPVIPGSALKGVLSLFWPREREKGSESFRLFGGDNPKDSSAGQLLIGEARVLAFPVRSAKKSFVWVTSPMALQRFRRDSEMEFRIPEFPDEGQCLAPDGVALDGKVILEEYLFEKTGDSSDVANALKPLVNDDLWKTVGERLVILSDELFCFFVENACEVATRIKINDKTGTVDGGALFNQEQVPSETMFYFPVSAVSSADTGAEEALEKLHRMLEENENVIQVGGDASVGLGFCRTLFH